MKLEYDNVPEARRTSVRAVCCGAAAIACLVGAIVSIVGIWLPWSYMEYHPLVLICRRNRWPLTDAGYGWFIVGLIAAAALLLAIGNPKFWSSWLTEKQEAHDDLAP